MKRDLFNVLLEKNLRIALPYLVKKLSQVKGLRNRRAILDELVFLVTIRCLVKTQLQEINTEEEVKGVICQQAKDVFFHFWHHRRQLLFFAHLFTRARPLSEDHCAENNVEIQVESKSLFEYLQNNLSEEEYSLLHLHVIKDTPFSDLTDFFQTTEGCLRIRWFRLKKKIKRLIQKEMVQ